MQITPFNKSWNIFGCEIIISELDGKPNVISFKGTADSILHSFHRNSSKAGTESEKNAVIKTAAKLIMKDIKDMQFSKEIYPSADEMMTIETNKKYVPSSLMLFLEHLVSSKNADTKTIAIGQSIVQSAIPRGVILGLGVQMHHHFGSKFVDTLNSLGISSSYTEVQKYEAAAATNWSIEIEKEQTDQAIQFVADNLMVTFHGMGIIATITPGVKSSRVIPRIASTTEDLLSVGKINVTFYSPLINNFGTLTFQSLNEVNDVIDQTQNLEQLVDISRPLKTQCPSWSGFMQTTQTGRHPGKSTVLFLPMIDLNPSDLTCIYSTLDFVATQAKKLSVSPIVIFDQPLYWKAVQMVMNEPENSTIKAMVIRLGGFHIQMSFLGCIGHLMQNSGLQELIETVYAPNTVTHMLSGKAVSRAVRGHILVDSALKSFLVERVFPLASQNENSDFSSESMQCLLARYSCWVLSSKVISRIKQNSTTLASDRKLGTSLDDNERDAAILCSCWPSLISKIRMVIEQALMRSVKSAGGLTRDREMLEIQRVQWLLSMPACSDVNTAIQEYTGQRYETSDQHKDTQSSRVAQDIKDTDTFLTFLKLRSPLSEESKLRNIETGTVGEENVNVDTAKRIGEAILKEMEGKTVASHSFKRSSKAVTLGTKNAVKIGDEEIYVDPQLLFQRLLTVSDASLDNPFEVFKYELSAVPAALFDSSGLMREAQKPSLANAIWELGVCGGEILTENVMYVLDGGSLLHRIPWKHGDTFQEICQSYIRLVHKHYGCANIIFDGYRGQPTTKDQTHQRRSKGITGTKVFFEENTSFKTKKELFLSNTENKQNFINMLSAHLSQSGCHTSHAEADADLLIVKTAIRAAEHSQVVVIGEDTDLLVLLCFYANSDANNIFFTSASKASFKGKKIWDLHPQDHSCAWGRSAKTARCDTTSRLYGIGKGATLKKTVSDEKIRNHAIQTKKSAVLVQSLPPTSNAAKYHSYRVYLQVQTWIGRDISPTDWGWTMNGDKLVPVKTSLPAAPERLLKMIRCCCRQKCDSKRCTCRKHGLCCTAACGECHGLSCSNKGELFDETEQD
ncbi:hypothetical protein MAR_027750 [Mya arenaria]|uniref:Tesmin/TSO1-like CXC domain-containing protein n=1 Tax=Mya arenaria TaxID=6604 RepID=A0ABY7EWA3_MYAAR|nr:hypothetical protein MAR_027750 [Mya arenaria]